MVNILLVEANEDLISKVEGNLKLNGFKVESQTRSAIYFELDKKKFDLAIIDYYVQEPGLYSINEIQNAQNILVRNKQVMEFNEDFSHKDPFFNNLIGGIHIISRLKQLYPSMPIISTRVSNSGYDESKDKADKKIVKPYGLKELLYSINTLLEQYSLN